MSQVLVDVDVLVIAVGIGKSCSACRLSLTTDWASVLVPMFPSLHRASSPCWIRSVAFGSLTCRRLLMMVRVFICSSVPLLLALRSCVIHIHQLVRMAW
jgi:hypothetical protein